MEYLLLIITLVGIIVGADYLVSGAVGIARRFRISEFVIGVAIVGIGTSMPELTVSFIGALEGNAEVAIGNVVGSNIFNILGILGVTALLFPMKVSRTNLKFEIPLCVGLSILLTLLSFNFFILPEPMLSRYDGLILMMVFIVFMWLSFRKGMKEADVKPFDSMEVAPAPNIWISTAKALGGLAVLIFSCDYFINSAVGIAESFGVNDGFISITLIACGTSLPELAASVTAAAKKNSDLSLGNIVGSNIFNIGFILGLSSQVSPLNSPQITPVDYAVMVLAAILPLLFGLKGRISRLGGGFMLLCYICYTVYLVKMQII